MKLFGIGTAGLLGMLVILCVAAVLIGQGREMEANDVVRARIGLCDNVPCFMGIQPGKTPWEVVHQMVAAMPDDEVMRNDDREVHMIFRDGTHVNITRTASRNVEAN